MLKPHASQAAVAAAGILLAVALAACGDDVTINPIEPEVNVAPQILEQGPTFPSGAVDYDQGLPAPYVVVSDGNGLDDIGAVLFKIDSAILHRVIFRRDSVASPRSPFVIYAPNDTVDLSALLPGQLTVVTDYPMDPSQPGLYVVHPFGWSPYGGYAFPRIDLASDAFGPAISYGPQAGDSFMKFSVGPPVADPPVDVNVTYVDVEYSGIEVVVYDGAGAMVSTTFPNLRVVFATRKERSTPP